MEQYPLKDLDSLYDNIENMKASEVKKYVSFLSKKQDCDFKSLIELLKNDKRKTVRGLTLSLYKKIENEKKEILRVKNMYDFDKNILHKGYLAGVDEVGRGPLAGPIVAASVVLNLDYTNDSELILKINDSKKISLSLRETLNKKIKEVAVSYSIFELDNNEIDNKGIAYCNNEVLKKASETLKIEPSLVLSDGYPIKKGSYPNEFVIKGDGKSASIACASIIAKVYRDNIMKEYARIYPNYGFEKNVGYGTKEHIEAIKKYGYTPIHRKSFLKNIINIF